MPPVYLDHNATSPLRPEAREAMLRALAGPCGNASSPHLSGRAARQAIETAREEVARLLGAAPGEIVLTSGGTESNNLAVYGAAGLFTAEARRIVTSAIEHPSILAPLQDLERRGLEVVRVRPGRDGVIDPDDVLRSAAAGTALVSLMLANNEIGTVQPVREIGSGLRKRGVLVHCDAAQAAGRIPIDVRGLGVDLLTIAGHKFGAPQGTGALYVRESLVLRPLLRGGAQELNRRPGTENVAALAGLGAAATAAARTMAADAVRIAGLRDRLESRALEGVPGLKVNGGGVLRVPNTSSLAIEGASGEALVFALDLEGIAVSAGAACSAGTIRRSHVLQAMGLEDEAASTIRVSLGPSTTGEDVEAFARALAPVVERIRAAARDGVRGRA